MAYVMHDCCVPSKETPLAEALAGTNLKSICHLQVKLLHIYWVVQAAVIRGSLHGHCYC